MPTIVTPTEPTSLSRVDLLALVAVLQRQMAELIASHEALRAEVDEFKRAGKRQAAPGPKSTREPAPKRPGQKPSSGTFRSREAPLPAAITALPVDVQVTLDECPACGGLLVEERVDFADGPVRPSLPCLQVTGLP
jgi:hypothetical protein